MADVRAADLPGSRHVVVFGDVFDDIVVVPRGPIRPDTDTTASINSQAGGSAANTAAWLGVAGAMVDFVGTVAAVDLERHSALLRDCGVTPHLTAHLTLPTGTIVVLVDGDSRSMLTERGANSALHPDAVTDELLAAAGILHLTGYSIVDAVDPTAFERLIERAIERSVSVSVDPGSAGYLADFGVARFLAAVSGAAVIFPNLAEGRLLTGEHDARAVVTSLAERFPIVALKLGPAGVLIAAGGDVVEVDAPSIRITDPTGAGDAFCAGFLAAWNSGADMRDAAEAGVRLASRAVVIPGGRPAAHCAL